jgi:hypothetical protein
MADPGLQFAGRAVERIPLRRGLLQSDPPHTHQIVQDVRIHRFNWDNRAFNRRGYRAGGDTVLRRDAAPRLVHSARGDYACAHTGDGDVGLERHARADATMPFNDTSIHQCCAIVLCAPTSRTYTGMLHFACCMNVSHGSCCNGHCCNGACCCCHCCNGAQGDRVGPERQVPADARGQRPPTRRRRCHSNRQEVRITATTSSVHVSSNESHTSTALYPAWHTVSHAACLVPHPSGS